MSDVATIALAMIPLFLVFLYTVAVAFMFMQRAHEAERRARQWQEIAEKQRADA